MCSSFFLLIWSLLVLFSSFVDVCFYYFFMSAVKTILFSLNTALVESKLSQCFIFTLIQFEILFIYSEIFFLFTHWLFVSVLFSFQVLGTFLHVVLLLIFNFFHCGQRTCFEWFQAFNIYWDLFYGPAYSLSWWTHMYFIVWGIVFC